jgi:hypothetical protein
MRKALFVAVVLALLVTAAMLTPMTVSAQTQSDSAKSGPPAVIQVIREDVKPGKGPAHEKSEAMWAAAYKKANLKYYYLATTTMSGPSEAWFFAAFDSMGDVEKANEALAANKTVQAEIDRIGATDGDMLSGTRSAFLFYNAELSYHPNFNIGDYKYLMVDTVKLKPGHFDQFAALRKTVNEAHEKAGLDEHMLVYTVGLGGPGGTVLVFQPVKSLTEYDSMGKSHGKGSAYFEAVGDENRKKFTEYAREDQTFFQRDFLAISPAMSAMSEHVMAANPTFWKPKTAMAKAPAGKGTTPAAKKEPARKEAVQTEKKK